MNAERERLDMVENQLRSRGIRDERVLRAMAKVPRHEFVPLEDLWRAYSDGPIPIGYEQTISQPYVVAFMAEKLEIQFTDKILEIGTGCGYSAAVLAEIAKDVHSIEIVEPLHAETKKRLERLGYKNIHLRHGDGHKGWPEEAPFDKIALTAAPEKIPEVLLDQLKDGGFLIAPVGPRDGQHLVRYRKNGDNRSKETFGLVSFVPMISP